MKKKVNWLKTSAAALAAVMMFQSIALAEPLDELNEILQKQSETKSELDIALEEQLGLSDLKEAMEENGLQFTLEGQLSDETMKNPDIAEVIPEGAYYQANLQVDKKLKKWQFETGAGTNEGSLLDLVLYGDMEQLAFAIPQFFEGAIALRSGSFLNQYNGSVLQQLISTYGGSSVSGMENIPDFDLSFWPEAEKAVADVEEGTVFWAKNEFADEIQKLLEKVETEKREEAEETIYQMTVPTEEVVTLYRAVLDKYYNNILSVLTYTNVSGDSSDLQSQINQLMDALDKALGDELVADFHVKDGWLERITYELYMDTSVLTQETEEESNANPQAEEDALDIEGEFQGYVDYEIVFTDPQHPLDGIDYNISMQDTDRNEIMNMVITLQTEMENTVVRSDLSAVITVKEEENQEIQLLSGYLTYDTSSEKLDAVLAIADDEDEAAVLSLNSTLSDIEKGKGFRWIIDELNVTLDDGDETVGLKGEISLKADPGEFSAPQKETMLFEATENEIYGLFGQISVNVQNWMEQFAPEETEIEDDYNVYYGSEEESETEAVTELTPEAAA